MYMTKVLFNTEDYLEDNVGEAEFDNHDTAKSYFGEFIMEAVRTYEKRYNTNVSYIALAGTVGLWNGSPVGGRVLNYDQNPIECMGKVDSIEVVVDENDSILLKGYHHDGVHNMHIYIVADNTVEKLETKDLWDTPEGYEWLVKNRKPLKLYKSSRFYN